MEKLRVKHFFQPLIAAQQFPIWPKGVLGSISHNQKMAGAFVLLANPNISGVGFDIETIFDKYTALTIAQRILSKQERGFYHFFNTFEEFVSVIFSSKEAFYKGAFKFINQRVDFSFIEICQVCVVKQYVKYIIKRSSAPYLPKGSTFKVSYKVHSTQVETHFLLFNKIE